MVCCDNQHYWLASSLWHPVLTTNIYSCSRVVAKFSKKLGLELDVVRFRITEYPTQKNDKGEVYNETVVESLCCCISGRHK